MTSRALILPTPGDPVMMAFWFEQFKEWHEKINRLYLVVNTPSEEFHEINERALGVLGGHRDKVCYIRMDNQIEHGDAINMALDEVEEDFVMLCEDDCFIFSGEVIDEVFEYLESGEYDVVGSKRGSCSQEILDAAKNKFGIGYHGWGDQGPNFWPCMFACRTSLLRQTNRDFKAHAWMRGERIEELDYVVKDEVCASDTFVWASLQIRNLVPELRIKYIPQNHAGPDDFQWEEEKRGLFDPNEKPLYCHVGSLSSGVHGALRDFGNRPLAYRKIREAEGSIRFEYKSIANGEKLEWERRIAWWYICLLNGREIDEVFWNEYAAALDRLLEYYCLDQKRMYRMVEMYRKLFDIPAFP